MIPELRRYKNELDKEYDPLGTVSIGMLYEAISCTVTEELNGEYELELEYPISGRYALEIIPGRLIYALHDESHVKGSNAYWELFQIYRISKGIKGALKVSAQHSTYRLNNVLVKPFNAASSSEVIDMLNDLHDMEKMPFLFRDYVEKEEVLKTDSPASVKNILGGENSLISTYGGDLFYNLFEVAFMPRRGRTAEETGIRLEYGRNLADFASEESIAETKTAVMPYWRGQNDDGENLEVFLPEGIVRSLKAGKYPYAMEEPLDLSNYFDKQPTAGELREAAYKYMSKEGFGDPSINFRLSFVHLWQALGHKAEPYQYLQLGDSITVALPRLGIETEGRVTRVSFDSLKERYSSIEIGNRKKSMDSEIDKKIKNATNRIRVGGGTGTSGGGGGFKPEIENWNEISWGYSSDEEVCAMIRDADNGFINLSDYWGVGQERVVKLPAIEGTPYVGEDQPEQEIRLTLINVGGKELVNPVKGTDGNERTECSFVVGVRGALATSGYMNSTATNSGGWHACARRQWCNINFRNAIPDSLRGVFKLHKNITGNGGSGDSGITSSPDYFALMALKESWFGENRNFENASERAALSGKQFAIFKREEFHRSLVWYRSPYTDSNKFNARNSYSGWTTGDANWTGCFIAPFGVI